MWDRQSTRTRSPTDCFDLWLRSRWPMRAPSLALQARLPDLGVTASLPLQEFCQRGPQAPLTPCAGLPVILTDQGCTASVDAPSLSDACSANVGRRCRLRTLTALPLMQARLRNRPSRLGCAFGGQSVS